MQETEGVIKYHLHHQPASLNADWNLAAINTWRTLLCQLELIGQQANRYQGYGFGNISQRTNEYQFIISGTQTGSLPELSKEHFCLVEKTNLKHNSLYSSGPCKPSSEALTHASIYAQDPSIQCIIHAHNPDIWHATQRLQLIHTGKDVAYGTPEMAQAVSTLFKSEQLKQRLLFTMLGHEDGVIAFGESFPQAAFTLINTLATAKQLAYNKASSK